MLRGKSNLKLNLSYGDLALGKNKKNFDQKIVAYLIGVWDTWGECLDVK